MNTNVYLETVDVAENEGRNLKKLGTHDWMVYRSGNIRKSY